MHAELLLSPDVAHTVGSLMELSQYSLPLPHASQVRLFSCWPGQPHVLSAPFSYVENEGDDRELTSLRPSHN